MSNCTTEHAHSMMHGTAYVNPCLQAFRPNAVCIFEVASQPKAPLAIPRGFLPLGYGVIVGAVVKRPTFGEPLVLWKYSPTRHYAASSPDAIKAINKTNISHVALVAPLPASSENMDTTGQTPLCR
jgi:hypothetical protein